MSKSLSQCSGRAEAAQRPSVQRSGLVGVSFAGFLISGWFWSGLLAIVAQGVVLGA